MSNFFKSSREPKSLDFNAWVTIWANFGILVVAVVELVSFRNDFATVHPTWLLLPVFIAPLFLSWLPGQLMLEHSPWTRNKSMAIGGLNIPLVYGTAALIAYLSGVNSNETLYLNWKMNSVLVAVALCFDLIWLFCFSAFSRVGTRHVQ